MALVNEVHACVSTAPEDLYALGTTKDFDEVTKQDAELEEIVVLTSTPYTAPEESTEEVVLEVVSKLSKA